MSDGFVVNLKDVADFTGRAVNVRDNYHEAGQLLEQADLSDQAKKDQLLSEPNIGSGGAREFHDACVTFIDTYASHLTTVRQVHLAAAQRLDYMVQALAETYQAYADFDARSAERFTDILRSLPTGQQGDDHGTA